LAGDKRGHLGQGIGRSGQSAAREDCGHKNDGQTPNTHGSKVTEIYGLVDEDLLRERGRE
jgi:hypothetical protein